MRRATGCHVSRAPSSAKAMSTHSTPSAAVLGSKVMGTAMPMAIEKNARKKRRGVCMGSRAYERNRTRVHHVIVRDEHAYAGHGGALAELRGRGQSGPR